MVDFSQPFNFAQHLFELNQQRADKIAYTDDHGTLSYGQLQDQARRMAAQENRQIYRQQQHLHEQQEAAHA